MRKALRWGLLATAAPSGFGQNAGLSPYAVEPVPPTPARKPDLSGVWQIPHTVADISDGQSPPYTPAGKGALDMPRLERAKKLGLIVVPTPSGIAGLSRAPARRSNRGIR